MRTLLTLAGAVLVLAGCAPAPRSPDAPALQGREVFMANGCHGCHTVGAVGTPIAPDLSRIGQRYSAAELARWLRDPAAQRPQAHMPRIALSPGEIEALATYLASLQ
jgi:cytochrome c oxidase subunit 2